MAVRGISISADGSSYIHLPITDTQHQIQRNLISEKSLNIAGEPKIVGGPFACSGSFSAAYRPAIFTDLIEHGLLGKTGGGVSNDFTLYKKLATTDEYGQGLIFGSIGLNSCEISMKAGEFAKCNFNWVGTDVVATTSVTVTASPSYDDPIPVFYNAVIGGYKVTGVTLKISRPLSADDYVIGSEYTQSIIQSDQLTIEGSFELAAKDASNLLGRVAYTGDTTGTYPPAVLASNKNTASLGSLVIVFNDPDGISPAIQTITLDDLWLSDGSGSASGRQRYQRTVNFKCTSSSTTGITFS